MPETPPPDDPDILNDHTVIRRVRRDWLREEPDGLRVSRQAFQDLTDTDGSKAMSVYILERLADCDLGPEAVVEGMTGYGYVLLSVAALRDQGFGIVWRPIAEEGLRGQAHAHVVCNKSGGRQKALVRASTLVLPTDSEAE